MKFYSFCLVIVIFMLNGCKSLIYYHTEADPEYEINKKANFTVFLPDNPTIEDKKMKKILETNLQKNGFTLSPSSRTQYSIFFKLYEETYSNIKSDTTYVPVTSYSVSYIGMTPVVTKTTSAEAVTETYTTTTTYKKMNVAIATRKDEKYETIWTGFASSRIGVYESNPPAIVDQLVKLIGQDFKDDMLVEMDPDKNPK